MLLVYFVWPVRRLNEEEILAFSIGVADMDRVTIPLLRTPPQSTARISIDTDSLHLPQDFEDRTADGRVSRSDRIRLRMVAVVLEDHVGGAATGIAERLV